jgi:hypothetical protein
MRTASPLVAAVLTAALAAPAAAQEAKKLSDPTVPSATSVATDDLFYILQSGSGKKITGTNLSSSMWTLLGGLPADSIDHYDQFDTSLAPSDGFALKWDADTSALFWGASPNFLESDYALLGGRSGGQELRGGSELNEDLSLIAHAGFGATPRIDLSGSVDRLDMTVAGNIVRLDSSAYYVFGPMQVTGVVATDDCVRIGDADAATNAVQLCRSSADDRIYHDTDSDGVKDAGEGFIDDTGGVKATLGIGASDMEAVLGSPTKSYQANATATWTLPDAATTRVCGQVHVPLGLRGSTFDFYVLVSPSTTASCNYRLSYYYKLLADGTALSSAPTETTPTSVASGGSAEVVDYVDTTANVATAGGTVAVSLCLARTGGHANDTCTNGLYVVGLMLEEQ